MAKNFKLLQERMPPGARARSAAKANEMLRQMALDELRAVLNLTQEHLAARLRIKQAAVSKMERRADMYISTLHRIIVAMGGELEIRAVLPNGEVVLIDQFSKLRKSRRGQAIPQVAGAL